jgi:hypothetical protein
MPHTSSDSDDSLSILPPPTTSSISSSMTQAPLDAFFSREKQSSARRNAPRLVKRKTPAADQDVATRPTKKFKVTPVDEKHEGPSSPNTSGKGIASYFYVSS